MSGWVVGSRAAKAPAGGDVHPLWQHRWWVHGWTGQHPLLGWNILWLLLSPTIWNSKPLNHYLAPPPPPPPPTHTPTNPPSRLQVQPSATCQYCLPQTPSPHAVAQLLMRALPPPRSASQMGG